VDAQTAMVVYLVIVTGGVLAGLTLRNRHQRYRLQLTQQMDVRELVAVQQELRGQLSELNRRVVAIQCLLEDAE
jgi:hypothetical protein